MKKKLFSLLKREAFFKKKVRLSSGRISNYYLDVRRVSLSPQGLYLISHLIWKIIKDDNVDAIGGPTLGADSLVSGVCFLAYKNKKNLKGFLIRSSAKKHGREKLIEGRELLPEERVVLVDDVATSGSSLIRAAQILKKEKVEIVKAVVIVDREEGAKENLSKLDCPLISLFTKKDFLND